MGATLCALAANSCALAANSCALAANSCALAATSCALAAVSCALAASATYSNWHGIHKTFNTWNILCQMKHLKYTLWLISHCCSLIWMLWTWSTDHRVAVWSSSLNVTCIRFQLAEGTWVHRAFRGLDPERWYVWLLVLLLAITTVCCSESASWVSLHPWFSHRNFNSYTCLYIIGVVMPIFFEQVFQWLYIPTGHECAHIHTFYKMFHGGGVVLH